MRIGSSSTIVVLECAVLSSFREQSPLFKKSKIELSFPFQRQAKYTENKLKAIKARNEYLLALEATNASVFKYYIHDLSDLIDVSAESWGSRVPLSWFWRSGQASPVLLLRQLRDFENNHEESSHDPPGACHAPGTR